VDAKRRVLGEAHEQTLRVLALLVEMRLKQERFQEAEPLLRSMMKTYDTSGNDSWRRYDAESLLGASLQGQNKYEEAELTLLAAYRGMQQRRHYCCELPSEDGVRRATNRPTLSTVGQA
jgi:hypothetical protein